MEIYKFDTLPEKKGFDTPQLWVNAPKGTSVFQTSAEIQFSIENQDFYHEKYREITENLNKLKDWNPVRP